MARRVYPDKLPNGVAVLGWDGSDFRVIRVDGEHNLQVDVLSSVRPTGAASEIALTELIDRIGDETFPDAGTVNAQLADILTRVEQITLDREVVKQWDHVIAAGSYLLMSAPISGTGYITDICLRVKGTAVAARESTMVIYADGIAGSYFYIDEGLYLSNGTVGNYAGIDIITFDGETFDYYMHWLTHIPFKESWQGWLYNGDAVNAITGRGMIAYVLEKP